MNTYLIEGESRQVGAIGILEPFSEYIEAENPKEAYTTIREKKYAEQREHVQIKAIWLECGTLSKVNPFEYLGV